MNAGRGVAAAHLYFFFIANEDLIRFLKEKKKTKEKMKPSRRETSLSGSVFVDRSRSMRFLSLTTLHISSDFRPSLTCGSLMKSIFCVPCSQATLKVTLRRSLRERVPERDGGSQPAAALVALLSISPSISRLSSAYYTLRRCDGAQINGSGGCKDVRGGQRGSTYQIQGLLPRCPLFPLSRRHPLSLASTLL